MLDVVDDEQQGTVAGRRAQQVEQASGTVGGATNTLVACRTRIGFLTDLSVPAQVRGFVSA
ncbi:hypothetical protein [Kitasatospora sp. NPDC093679]|uniref:hypothetical protein n=1 Tax=Kitasatospora sp. NPDC093679 TaxID=3154983 RepID=UPI00343FAE3A